MYICEEAQTLRKDTNEEDAYAASRVISGSYL